MLTDEAEQLWYVHGARVRACVRACVRVCVCVYVCVCVLGVDLLTEKWT